MLKILYPLLLAPLLAGASAPAEWKGEYFDKKQGGLFFKYALKGFKAGKQQAAITGALSVTVENLLRNKEYSFAQDQSDPEAFPRQIWKLPAGKYEITSLALVDAAGVKRTWATETRTSFVIKRQTLSNLGLWTLSPGKGASLAVTFGMIDNTYAEAKSKRESSVAAVVDGFTGLEQELFAGKKARSEAEAGNATKNELRASVTVTRQISMFYKLDLFKYNYHAKAVAAVLAVSDPKIRACYTDRLEDDPSAKGDVTFTFLLAKQTGTMLKLKRTGGVVKDAKFVECVYYELAQIQFPVPENMIGELTYVFDVR